jgi:hypothetical protein
MEAIEVVRGAYPLFNNVGWRYYFDPATAAVGEKHGLGVLKFYFIGRGGVLGDVEWPVVESAFGYFKPAMVEQIWNKCRKIMAPRLAAQVHLGCCAEFGRTHFTDIAAPDLESFCAAAEAVIKSAEPAGLALFAGFSAEPLPEDPPARAMHLVATLRELRGSAHLLAVVASGVSPLVAHTVKRPNDLAMFGWDPTDAPTVTEADRQLMAEVETWTDRLIAPAFAVLDDKGATHLLDGLAAINAPFADDTH